MTAAVSSMGLHPWLEITYGVPAAAAPRAMIRSLSGVTTDAAPMGARSSGDDIWVPTIEMRRSRSVTPCSMRGTIRHCSKASRLFRMVRPSPAPPAT